MTWFGIVWLSLIGLGMVITLINIGRNEPEVRTNFERWTQLGMAVVLVLGIIFVGTGLGV